MSDEQSKSRRDFLGKLAAGTVAASSSATLLSKLWVPSAYAISPALSGPSSTKAYVNFAINVQNFRYLNGSADIVVSLCKIFDRYGVQGDFYMTGPMTRKYKASRVDAINALRTQGISYHVRPPHPYFNYFDARFENAGNNLETRIERFETYALNLSTGDLNENAVGGFKLVKSAFGRAPACVGAPNDDSTIKQKACEYYKGQGATGVVWWHGTKVLDDPYVSKNGLLARPCDIVIDQWAASSSGSSKLWWNRFKNKNPSNDAAYPHNRIKSRVNAFGRKRPPHVVSLIHDDNFTRRGADPWLNTYWKDTAKTNAKTPPYNLDAKDPSSRRSDDERSRILKAYERMVEYCAENYTVVTMADISQMA